jgi:hypothetical protein
MNLSGNYRIVQFKALASNRTSGSKTCIIDLEVKHVQRIGNMILCINNDMPMVYFQISHQCQ